MQGESRERPQHAIVREDQTDTVEIHCERGSDGELGGANAEWIKSGAERGAIKGEVRG